jgi:hypothetical protein
MMFMSMGVRLRLWTVATNGPIVHPPGDMTAWITMVEWYRRRELPIRPYLSGNPTSSHLVANRGKGMMNLSLRSIFVHTCKWFFTYRKSYDMGPTALLPLPRKACYGFLSPLKVHRLGWVWTRKLCVYGKHDNHYTTEVTMTNHIP